MINHKVTIQIWAKKKDDCWQDGIKGSNKVGKWKSCHQEREKEHFGVTMAKPLCTF
jgi:hypothetical protein